MGDLGEDLWIDLNPALQAVAESNEVQSYTVGGGVQKRASDAQLYSLNTAWSTELTDVVGEIANVDCQRAGRASRIAACIGIGPPIPVQDTSNVVARYAHALQFQESPCTCAVTANSINISRDRGAVPPLQLQKMSKLQVNIAVIEPPPLRLAIGFLGGFKIALFLHGVPVLHPYSAQVRIDSDSLPISFGRCPPARMTAMEIAEPDCLLSNEGFDESD
ncbi:MAG: hypothetical protein APF80_16680 [Alphaproteobacteria bacterium BRH_c36]|nr:MAG: hypothetical protein APF80_16680 [Alphaproteobacteria bacterium BRH_c36]